MSIAEKLTKVAENVPKVYVAGKEAEYNAFWDAYIGKDGDVIASVSMFSGYRWTDDIYKPTHTIKSSAFSSMYQNCPITDTKVALDLSSGSGTNLFFNANNMKNVVKLIVADKNTYNSWFYGCSALEEIRFEGTIGKSLDIHWSKKLSMTSLASIVGALSDTVTEQTLTLPTTAESNYDSETYTGRWKEVVASKPNWTFAYA